MSWSFYSAHLTLLVPQLEGRLGPFLFHFSLTLYIDVVLSFFSFFWKTSVCARARRVRAKVGGQFFLRDHDFTVSQTEDQFSRIYSPCSNKVRSTWAELYIIKTSFQSEHNDDRFRRNVHISSWFRGRQGNSMAEMSASLIA